MAVARETRPTQHSPAATTGSQRTADSGVSGTDSPSSLANVVTRLSVDGVACSPTASSTWSSSGCSCLSSSSATVSSLPHTASTSSATSAISTTSATSAPTSHSAHTDLGCSLPTATLGDCMSTVVLRHSPPSRQDACPEGQCRGGLKGEPANGEIMSIRCMCSCLSERVCSSLAVGQPIASVVCRCCVQGASEPAARLTPASSTDSCDTQVHSQRSRSLEQPSGTLRSRLVGLEAAMTSVNGDVDASSAELPSDLVSLESVAIASASATATPRVGRVSLKPLAFLRRAVFKAASSRPEPAGRCLEAPIKPGLNGLVRVRRWRTGTSDRLDSVFASESAQTVTALTTPGRQDPAEPAGPAEASRSGVKRRNSRSSLRFVMTQWRTGTNPV
ncbi:unnamed protein product [Protopolystoma xenopodis]|uniref:Uncharacterized protein n=1 Tax=Protopolystoma xenopodis TaxID=117903 RepID=A0A3S5AHL1_9PLAT|nr:unnamed protein product [Protopolystoma xenopodis]